MINEDYEQRSVGWYKARLGNISGSKVSVLMSKGRKKEDVFSATGKAYLYQVAAERQFNPAFLDDDTFEDYVRQVDITTKAMQWGIDNEDAARRLFCTITGYEVFDVSSCSHDTIPHFSASPDGLIRNIDGNGKFGVLEIKCPSLGTFEQYKAEVHDAASLKEVKPEYYWQMLAEMDCTDTRSGRFVAYCPWLTEPIHIAEIDINEEDVKAMEEKVKLANEFIENIINPNK